MNNSEDLKIETASVEDAEAIKHINYDSWLATYPNESAGITLDDIKIRLKDALSLERIEKFKEKIRIANASVDERYFVAKQDGTVAGYCHIKTYPDKNQLHAIYISPQHVGRGTGTKLWDACKEFFDKNKDIYVEAASYNSNAIKFYKKLGFIETGRSFTDERFVMQSGAMIPEIELVIRNNVETI